jgi:hypothetical protein
MKQKYSDDRRTLIKAKTEDLTVEDLIQEEEMVVNTEDPRPSTVGRYESDCFASFPLVCTPLRWGEGSIGVLNVVSVLMLP